MKQDFSLHESMLTTPDHPSGPSGDWKWFPKFIKCGLTVTAASSLSTCESIPSGPMGRSVSSLLSPNLILFY